MFFSDWFYRILAYLGLRQKETRTLLLVLHHDFREILGERSRFVLGDEDPTRPGYWELSIENIEFKVFELGDRQMARRVLKDYHVKVDAVAIMMVGCIELVVADADSWLANREDLLVASTSVRDRYFNEALSPGFFWSSYLKIEMFAESKEKPIVSLLFNFLFTRRSLLRVHH